MPYLTDYYADFGSYPVKPIYDPVAKRDAMVRWLYPERAGRIINGEDEATNADIALWRRVGGRP